MTSIHPGDGAPRTRPSDVDVVCYAVKLRKGFLRLTNMLKDMGGKDGSEVLVGEGDRLHGFSDDVGALSGVLGVQGHITTAIHSIRSPHHEQRLSFLASGFQRLGVQAAAFIESVSQPDPFPPQKRFQ
jgi:hypothetical protein